MTDTVTRPYSTEDVERLRGSVRSSTRSRGSAPSGSVTCWTTRDWVPALGAMTGGQAVQMVKAGLEAIYLSGWQVAADANLVGRHVPRPEPLPRELGPALARRISNALLRADQIAHAEGDDETYWLAPIVADAEAGFGGPLNAFEIMKAYIEAGAAAVHFEDQLSSEKKCGHLGGKVLVPTSQFVRTLVAARLAADVLDVPTLIVARTDALSASLLTSDVDEIDREFCTGERTPEGFFRVRDGHRRRDRARARVRAVRRPRLVRDVDARHGARRSSSPRAIHERFPGKLLAYNCSPSFNWRRSPVRRARSRGSSATSRRWATGSSSSRSPASTRSTSRCSSSPAATATRRCPRTSRLQEREFALEERRLHGDPPPARGRRRLLRPGDAGDLRRRRRRRSP